MFNIKKGLQTRRVFAMTFCVYFCQIPLYTLLRHNLDFPSDVRIHLKPSFCILGVLFFVQLVSIKKVPKYVALPYCVVLLQWILITLSVYLCLLFNPFYSALEIFTHTNVCVYAHALSLSHTHTNPHIPSP